MKFHHLFEFGIIKTYCPNFVSVEILILTFIEVQLSLINSKNISFVHGINLLMTVFSGFQYMICLHFNTIKYFIQFYICKIICRKLLTQNIQRMTREFSDFLGLQLACIIGDTVFSSPFLVYKKNVFRQKIRLIYLSFVKRRE